MLSLCEIVNSNVIGSCSCNSGYSGDRCQNSVSANAPPPPEPWMLSNIQDLELKVEVFITVTAHSSSDYCSGAPDGKPIVTETYAGLSVAGPSMGDSRDSIDTRGMTPISTLNTP